MARPKGSKNAVRTKKANIDYLFCHSRKIPYSKRCISISIQ